eukprot:3512920-Pleurochrysis_carterae.AAC.1
MIPTIQGSERGRGRKAGRAYGVAPGRRRSGEVCHRRCGDSRTQRAERECSASTHAMRIKFGNCACECQTARKGDSFRN